MATERQHELLTVEDYMALPADGKRYELLEGELVVVPSPNTAHQRIVGNLYLLLRQHVQRNALGEVFTAPYDIVLGHRVVAQPDLVFVSQENAEIILPAHVRGVPDLVVEVVSPSSAKRDLLQKRRIYARYGVPNYWVVDPDDREVVAFVLEDEEYREAAVASRAERFSAPPFSDLQLPLVEIWSD